MPVRKARETILVLGGTGKVARLLRSYWTSHPPENLDVFWVARNPAPGITHVWQPGQAVDSLPQCNIVFSLWGTISGSEQELTGNISLALEAHRVARDMGARHVFHASSVAVYRPKTQPIQESDLCEPRNPYGRAKLEMERAVRQEMPGSTCLRMANVVGADSLFSALSGDAPITLDAFPDGSGPRRSYLRPATLALALEHLSVKTGAALPGVLNLADKGVVDMGDIVACTGRHMIRSAAPDGALPVMSIDVSALENCLDVSMTPVSAQDICDAWMDARDQS